MLARGVSCWPGAAPAGRAEVNSPTAYTVLPTTSWSHTTPLIWTVGRASAVTVAEVSVVTRLSGIPTRRKSMNL